MSKISTTDCKQFLVNQFPETKTTLWKRVTKYKNTDGQTVRVFQYNDNKMIGLVENGNTLSIVKEDETLERKNSASVNYHVTEEDRNEFSNGFGPEFTSDFHYNFKTPVRDPDELESLTGVFQPGAQKFIFAVSKEMFNMMDLGTCVCVAIVEYDYWLNEGGMNDDASEEPANYMPPEWQAEDVNQGGQWLVYTNLTPTQVEMKLKSIGFMWTQEFDDFMSQF